MLVEAFILISELFTIPELLIGRETKTDSSKTPGGNVPTSSVAIGRFGSVCCKSRGR